MSLTKYTNIEDINNRTTNVGEFIRKEDNFVISQNETVDSSFGNCDTDILEFTVYDINNNIVSQKDNKLVSYVKGQNISEYLIKTDTKEFAVDVEKLLTNAGLTNGIFKVNIKFLREKLGTENELTRAFIQQISSTRQEIRILPLKVQSSEEITNKNIKELESLQELDVDYETYKKHIQDSLNFSGENIVTKAEEYIENRFQFIGGLETFDKILREDFGIEQGFSNAMNVIYAYIRTKVLQELETQQNILEQSDELTKCSVIPSEIYDRVMANIIQQSINDVYLSTRAISTESDINTASESVEERNFETRKNLTQFIVTDNVQEYTQVDLSEIQLSASNIDNFDKLNSDLQLKLSNPTEKPTNTTPTDTTPTDTGTDTATPIFTAIELYLYTTKDDACLNNGAKIITAYISGTLWETAQFLYRNPDGSGLITSTTKVYYIPVNGGSLKSRAPSGLLSTEICVK
jgi:hypothetical protein